jgi:hypothetical protein
VLAGRTRLAFVSFCPMPLDVDVERLSTFLDFGSRLWAVQERGAESIQFVVQSDELIHKIVLHLALASRCHMGKPLFWSVLIGARRSFLLLLRCVQSGFVLLRACANVLRILGCEQSVKFVASKFSSVQSMFPSRFKLKGWPVWPGSIVRGA